MDQDPSGDTHCSCTCPMGKDPWAEDNQKLSDDRAGSTAFPRSRVRGYECRCSVFPKIPGYFILGAHMYMMAKKAADTLL